MLELKTLSGRVIEVGLNPMYYDLSYVTIKLENSNLIGLIATHDTAKKLGERLYQEVSFEIREPVSCFPPEEAKKSQQA